jgi:hypothetical protein
MHLATRRILLAGCSANPHEAWMAQQARNPQPADPRIPDLVISRPDLAARVIAAAREWALRGAKRL